MHDTEFGIVHLNESRGNIHVDGTQTRDAVLLAVDDTLSLHHLIEQECARAGLKVEVPTSKPGSGVPIVREPDGFLKRWLRALATFRAPEQTYHVVEDWTRYEPNELPRALHARIGWDRDDNTAEGKWLWFAVTSVQIVIYDPVWGRNGVLLPTLNRLGIRI